MPKLSPKALGNWDDDPLLPSLSVHEFLSEDTGLVDADGNSLYRFPLPIGFGRDDEW